MLFNFPTTDEIREAVRRALAEQANNKPPSIQPITLSVEQAAEATSLSNAYIRQAIFQGRLPARKVGTRTIIFVSDLADWLRSFPSTKGGSDETLQA